MVGPAATYRANNVTTVGGIITGYGGGPRLSAYIQFVAKTTGFSPDTIIDLNNDRQVLQFGRAMFRYEAGRAPPWSDDDFYGIRGGRVFAGTGAWPATPPTIRRRRGLWRTGTLITAICCRCCKNC